jgi:hypothetical protein
VTTTVTWKSIRLPAQCTAGVAELAAAAEPEGSGTRHGYRTDVTAATPGRIARNAAPVTPTGSVIRGSTAGLRDPELTRGGCHLSLGVPRSKTRTTLPVVTQNVLPLSCAERFRAPAAGSDAGQAGAVPDGDVAADGVGATAVTLDAAPAAGLVVAACAHPAVASTPITVAAA